MYALAPVLFLWNTIQGLFHLAAFLAFVLGIPTLTGVYSWHNRKDRPLMSTIGWIFTGLWSTGVVIVVGYAIAWIVNPPQFQG